MGKRMDSLLLKNPPNVCCFCSWVSRVAPAPPLFFPSSSSSSSSPGRLKTKPQRGLENGSRYSLVNVKCILILHTTLSTKKKIFSASGDKMINNSLGRHRSIVINSEDGFFAVS